MTYALARLDRALGVWLSQLCVRARVCVALDRLHELRHERTGVRCTVAKYPLHEHAVARARRRGTRALALLVVRISCRCSRVVRCIVGAAKARKHLESCREHRLLDRARLRDAPKNNKVGARVRCWLGLVARDVHERLGREHRRAEDIGPRNHIGVLLAHGCRQRAASERGIASVH